MLRSNDCIEDKLGLMVHAVETALVPSKLDDWPRHRWRGADLALNKYGLMDAIHAILFHTFPLFVQAFYSPPIPSSIMPDTEPMQPIAAAEHEQQQDGEHQASGPGQQQEKETEAPSYQQQQDQPGPEKQNRPETPAEANSRFMRKASQFIRAPPSNLTNAMLTARLRMEPLRVFLDKKLFVGSKQWELHQQARAAAPPPGSTWPHREFSLTISASNRFESAFFEQMSHLHNPDMWLSITYPTEARCHLRRSEKQ